VTGFAGLPSPPGSLEAEVKLYATLYIQLYLQRAAEYVAVKLGEGVLGVEVDLASLGFDTGPIVDALAVYQRAELAREAARYRELADEALHKWDLGLETLPGSKLTAMVVELARSEVTKLVANARAFLGKLLREAEAVVIDKVLAPIVHRVYAAGKWLVRLGARAGLSGAGDIVSAGRHIGEVFRRSRPSQAKTRFQASEPTLLKVMPLTSVQGLGFGARRLSQLEALSVAQALVKYELPTATVRPLLASSDTPRPNEPICIAGGLLSERALRAEIELSGPEYRGYALVDTRDGVAGGCFMLPAEKKPGPWTIGVVDYSAPNSSAGVLVDAFTFLGGQAEKRTRRGTDWTLVGAGTGTALLTAMAWLVLLARRRPATLLSRAYRRGALVWASWSTRDLVVVMLGFSLVVFAGGATAAVAAGHTPPAAMWAAGSAVLGGMMGLLVPPPGAGRARARQPAAAHAAETDAERELARAKAVARAAELPETRGAAVLLLIFFTLSLGLSIALADGAVVPKHHLLGSLKDITTALFALASASGTALIGLLAPSPLGQRKHKPLRS
jgi:hypothetical protein